MKPILLLTLLLFIAGCGQPLPTPAATPAPTTTPQPATATPFPAVADPLSASLLYDLTSGDSALVQATTVAIVNAGDVRFVPAFIELLRAAQIGLVQGAPVFAEALDRLTGQEFGGNWAAWIEWYGQTDIVPPPGFTTWKGRLLARIDPEFADFLQDEHPSRLRVEEIVWGGVVVDGIPALDNPPMMPAFQADHLLPEESVFGLVSNDEARAYPLRYMDWHEMANDVIGGVPVSIAYCTLCGAAVAYDGRASDGHTYDFGSSGFLYRSNKLMYDRQSRTLWNQLTGEPVLGPLAGSEVRLELLPIVLTTWAEWQAQQPDTLVMGPDTGFNRTYVPGAAYGDYFASERTMFPVWQRSDLLDAKAQIYALRLHDLPKAYPLETLLAERVINDSLGGTNVVLLALGEAVQVQGNSLRIGPITYQSGAEVLAFERGELLFQPGENGEMVLDNAGNSWQITAEALIGPSGQTLPRLSGHLAYWFGWYAFFPQTAVYGR